MEIPLKIVELRETFDLYRGDKEFMPGKAVAEQFGVNYTVIAPNLTSTIDRAMGAVKGSRIDGTVIPGTGTKYKIVTLPAWKLLVPIVPRRPFEIVKQKPHIIVNTGLMMGPKDHVALVLSKLLRIPLVLLDAGNKNFTFASIKSRAVSPIEGPYCRRMDAIITYNELGRNRIVNELGVESSKVHVIPKGVNLNDFSPSSSPEPFFVEFGLPRQFTVLYCNRLVPLKAPDAVIRVAEVLKEKGIDQINFVLVGDGESREGLQSYCKDHKLTNVFFTGALPHEKVNHAYAAADVILYPFPPVALMDCNGFPTVMAEAMAMGKPIILGNRGFEGAMPLKHMETALFSEPGNAEEMADCLLILYEDAALREKLGGAARSYAEENMDWYKQADQYYDIFCKLRCSA